MSWGSTSARSPPVTSTRSWRHSSQTATPASLRAAEYVHTATGGLRAFYELLFSNGGGIQLEHCAVVDDKRACALEYNVVQWGEAELPPQAGVAVYVRGQGGKLAAARIYDDVDPPVGQGM